MVLLLVPFILRLDGKVHADWQQFLGRFHPLVVHLPIGLILLLPLLEFAGRVRPALREAAAFVLSLGVVACLVAVALGYLLAYGCGDAEPLVTRHMWGGIALTLAMMACALVRPVWINGSLPWSYPAMLACVILLLGWAAHQGGSITHGENYLTEFLPGPLQHRAGTDTPNAKTLPIPGSFYGKHVYPALDAKCVSCHGESKVKGRLRLDSYEALMKGGKDGAVIVPGQPDRSLLLQRVTLPITHKQFMPAEGKSPLNAQEIGLIRAWIADGASSTATSVAGVTVHEDEPVPQVADYTALQPQIAGVAKTAGVTVVPVSRNLRDGLILNTVDASGAFGDAQLEKFEPFAPYIVEVELARTGVSDAAIGILARFPHLRAIHLEETHISGTGLDQFTHLPELTYVNLSGTRVTAAAVAPLVSMKTLRHLYLYNTPAHPAVAVPVDQPTTRKSP